MIKLRNWVLSTALALLLPGCSGYYVGEVSDHFDGEKFFNPGKPMKKGFGDFLKWQVTAERGQWPEFSILQTFDSPPERVYGNQLRVSHVGHSTLLIQTQGINILTDPIWSDRASFLSWVGPKRVHPPGIKWENLPPVDLVLISHNHYDHLDLPTLQRLWVEKKPRIVVPLGNRAIVTRALPGVEAEEYDWSDSVEISQDVKVHLEPMHHWSARSLSDRNSALWAAYVIETPGGNIYFVGDSGYGNGDYFRDVIEKYGSIRFAAIPMGDYEPRWFMDYNHMNPQELMLAYEDLAMPYILPIHHMVFPLADTGYAEPRNQLTQVVSKTPAAGAKIQVLLPGQFWDVPE